MRANLRAGRRGGGGCLEARSQSHTAELGRLVDLSLDMLCTATMSGRFVVVNPAWCLTLGYAEDELVGRKVIELVHSLDRARTRAEALRLAEPGYEVRDFENRLLHRDGTHRWLLWSARSDGERLYAVARDITERRRDEREALVATQRFRSAFEDAPIGMAVFGLDERRDYRPIEVNRALCDLVGYPQGDLLEGRVLARDLVHPDDREIGGDDIGRLLRGECDTCSFEKRFLRRDARVIWAQVRLSLVRDERGLPLYGIGQFQDVTDTREAHDALRASELRLRTLLETAHEGIWVLDTNDRTAFVNSRMAEMLGCSMAAMLGRPLYDFLAPDAKPLAHELMEAGRRGVSDQHELKLVREDGGEVWAILASSPFAGLEGSYAGALAMVTDITGRKRQEQAVRASAERYRNIIETTSEGVWMIDADHRTTYVNRRMAEMLGYGVDEMLGRPVEDFVRHGRRDPLETGLERQGLSDQREVCFVRGDGAEVWGLLSGSPLTDGSGAYGGALAMISDITERKHAEEALARLAAIVDASPDAIFSTATDGTITSWNRAAERLYGYSAEEAIGRPATIIAPPGSHDESQLLSQRLRDGDQIEAFHTHGLRKDGTLVEVIPSLSAIKAADGRVVGALAIVRSAAPGSQSQSQ